MFLPLYFLQPEELLSVHFVQFTQDVFDRVIEFGYDNMLDSVDASIGLPNHFVENCECCLERGKFDKGFNSFCVDLLGPEDLLSTTTKSS